METFKSEQEPVKSLEVMRTEREMLLERAGELATAIAKHGESSTDTPIESEGYVGFGFGEELESVVRNIRALEEAILKRTIEEGREKGNQRI
jgi:hypothetical protein